ncbi:Glycosyl transferase, group 1 [Desulfovibrionales bacterium]
MTLSYSGTAYTEYYATKISQHHMCCNPQLMNNFKEMESEGKKLFFYSSLHSKYSLLPSSTIQPTHVVLLVQNLLFGGSQRQALELAGRIDRKHFSVEVWALTSGEDLIPLAKQYGVSVRWLSRRTRVGPQSLWNLWHALKSERPDVLVLFTAVPNTWGRLLGRLARVQWIVATVRGGRASYLQHERWLWRLADYHLCNSMDLKDVLTTDCSVPTGRIGVVHNGVDLKLYRPPTKPQPAGPPVAICVARLVPDKDHATLLTAFARVITKLPRAQLRLVGNGPLEKKLKQQANDLGIAGQVNFLPGQLDVAPLLADAHCFVLSSIREGLPNVILEAMAIGLPIAATAVGGVPELVAHGQTGLLASAGDPTGLAKIMIILLANSVLRERYGHAGRIKVEECFSFTAMIQAHENLLKSLIAS